MFAVSFAVTTFTMVAIAVSTFVVFTMAWFSFRGGLLYSGVIVVHDDDGIATLTLLVLGMAWIGCARMVRVVRVFGPAFFVVFVVTSFAVFHNHNWPGASAFLVAGDVAR